LKVLVATADEFWAVVIEDRSDEEVVISLDDEVASVCDTANVVVGRGQMFLSMMSDRV
jgi:hypothetical protein